LVSWGWKWPRHWKWCLMCRYSEGLRIYGGAILSISFDWTEKVRISHDVQQETEGPYRGSEDTEVGWDMGDEWACLSFCNWLAPSGMAIWDWRSTDEWLGR
jgi:hypothetical protein